MRRLGWIALAVAASAAPAPAADIADLFPADALAYAELREPAKLAPQVAAALAGSKLADVQKLVDARRDAARTVHDLVGKPQLALLGLVAAPEFAAEFGKLGGVAVGLTGFTATGEPEAAVAVLTGESAAAGLAARAFLATAAVRRVGAVDGVPVYQFRSPRFAYDPITGQQRLDNDKPPEEGAYEATAAYTPGLFVYGTSKEAIGAVVARYRGKGEAGLGASAAFRAARAAHPHPGVFLYADAAAVVAKLDAARRAGGGQPEPDAVGWFRILAGQRALKHVAGSIHMRDGAVAAELSVALVPGRVSPLPHLLAGTGAKAEFLGHAPPGAGGAVALALPEKDRAAAVLGFLDAAARASGGLGRTPSEAVKDIDARFKTKLADGLIAQTTAVTLVLPRPRASAGADLPTLVLHADGDETATAWMDAVPKVVAELSGRDPTPPSSEVIDGVKVESIAGADLPWRAAVHFARKGATVAVGADRPAVAAALGTREAVAPPALDRPAALVGLVRLSSLIGSSAGTARPPGPVVPVEPAPLPPRPGNPGPSAGSVDQQKAEEKAAAGVAAALDALPPAVVTARREGDVLRVEVAQAFAPDGLAAVVAAGLDWYDAVLNRTAGSAPGAPGSYPRFR